MPGHESTGNSVERPRRFVETRTIVVGLVVVILAVWGLWATSTSAAPRPVPPASVAMIETYEAMRDAYTATLAGDGVVLRSFEPWSDADRAAIAAAALLGTMEKASRDTWQPGYEGFLRELDFTPEEIRAAVFFAYGQQVALITDAVLLALGKPAG